ncbi:MAG TPA: hypothetical protein VIY29_11075 [Ktedonobacteraceae bacterium]
MQEDKKIRLVVKLHPGGGTIYSCTDVEQSPYVVSDFYALKLEEEAERFKREAWPKTDSKDIVFIIPETEETMKRLGFREFEPV